MNKLKQRYFSHIPWNFKTLSMWFLVHFVQILLDIFTMSCIKCLKLHKKLSPTKTHLFILRKSFLYCKIWKNNYIADFIACCFYLAHDVCTASPHKLWRENMPHTKHLLFFTEKIQMQKSINFSYLIEMTEYGFYC